MTTPYVPSLLATPEDLAKRMPELTRDIDASVLQDILEQATQSIEGRTGRRLAPFVGHVYQDRIGGVDPDEYGGGGNVPMGIESSLGMSQAMAYGYGIEDLARHLWLDHYAPMYPELWTYNVQSIEIYRTYGDQQSITFANGGVLGPDSTDGHIWLRIGTFGPVGSRIQVIYDGGYTVRVPAALKQACIWEAGKSLMIDAEPQNRKDMNLDEIDAQIAMLVGPWVRG